MFVLSRIYTNESFLVAVYDGEPYDVETWSVEMLSGGKHFRGTTVESERERGRRLKISKRISNERV